MMEKGSFHTSRPHSLQELEERVKAIPLPNQLPKGVDFSDIPAAALKSSTLEALITQNEDLMARLSVALRKSNELDERVASHEREAQNMRTRFETLKDQYLVMVEKDRMGNSRSAELTEQNLGYREKIAKLEKMYTDIFVQAQSFQRRLGRLERHRARMKRAAYSMRSQLQDAIGLREKVAEGQAQAEQITQSFAARLNEAREQVDIMRSKAAERDRMYNEKIEVENTLVLERRQFELSRTDASTRLDNLERETASLRLELKETLIDREDKTQELERLRSEIPSLRDERSRLTEQVESLQALWNHKQRELEQIDEKNKNLQKLNQNISVTLNQQRKEIHGLKNELEKERFAAGEKVKTLIKEIEMLRLRLTESGAQSSE
ncbi:MAG: hypothetical protein KF799_12675 [Bdellovibrionales bacterium]|nr:hypothetical protein [Bdellovibrionales bacterium]